MWQNRPYATVLDELLAAQRAADDATSFPNIERYALALVHLSERLDGPDLWPVGAAGEILAGAAILLSKGAVHHRSTCTALANGRVLLVAAALVTPLPFVLAAAQARRLGATDVFATGVDCNVCSEIVRPEIRSFEPLLMEDVELLRTA